MRSSLHTLFPLHANSRFLAFARNDKLVSTPMDECVRRSTRCFRCTQTADSSLSLGMTNLGLRRRTNAFVAPHVVSAARKQQVPRLRSERQTWVYADGRMRSSLHTLFPLHANSRFLGFARNDKLGSTPMDECVRRSTRCFRCTQTADSSPSPGMTSLGLRRRTNASAAPRVVSAARQQQIPRFRSE